MKLIVPIAMDKGLRFAIREGGRTVGAGQVTEIRSNAIDNNSGLAWAGPSGPALRREEAE